MRSLVFGVAIAALMLGSMGIRPALAAEAKCEPDKFATKYPSLVGKTIKVVADGTTGAIQSAINTCDNAGGGTVFFPPGRYNETGLIVGAYATSANHRQTYIFLEGAAPHASVLRYTGPDTGGFTVYLRGAQVLNGPGLLTSAPPANTRVTVGNSGAFADVGQRTFPADSICPAGDHDYLAFQITSHKIRDSPQSSVDQPRNLLGRL